MLDNKRMIFIHGLEGTSQGVKASLLHGLFPEMLIPDFRGTLEVRIASLEEYLGDKNNWTIVGSSFGGLMGAIFTCQRPEQVKKLVLLAPALVWPDFAKMPPQPVNVPVIAYHGSRDKIVPLEPVCSLAEKIFSNLDFRIVDDDHGLYKTVHQINWHLLLDAF